MTDDWGADPDIAPAGDRRPVLSRARHDRSALRRRDADWLGRPETRGHSLVVTPDGRAPIMTTADGPRLVWRPARTDEPWALLGELNGTSYGVVLPRAEAEPDATEPGDSEPDDTGERWAGLRELGALLPEAEAGLLVAATALVQWHHRHPFCPVCGQNSGATDAGWARRCPDGHEQFPRTDPAVIMLVHDGGDRCVLGRQEVWPPGRFSILAGFVEAGESAEGAVAREVWEEVGVRVTDIRYTGSQPWPFPQSLMLGFTARVDGDPTLRVDQDELAEAHWVSRDDVRSGAFARALPPSVSIAHRILSDWLAGDLP